MALFQMKWLRKFVRRHTNPIPITRAGTWKQRLSLAYALIAWNAFGFVCYMVYTGRRDWGDYYGLTTEEEKHIRPAQAFANLFGIEKTKVYRVSGFSVDSYEITSEGIKANNEISGIDVDKSQTDR